MKLQRRKVPIPKWAVFALALVTFVLIVGWIKLASVSFLDKSQLAFLTVVSGDVKVSDGINESAARSGAIFEQGARILVKTGRGIAYLKLRDSSYVIMDSHTTIEFNRQKETTAANFFVVNLIKGRLMIINQMRNRAPFQFLIGNNIVIRGFEAVMGLEVIDSSEVHAKFDCLGGLCQVNGIHFLKPGQNAQIGPENSVLITENVSLESWILLGKASKLNLALPNWLTRIAPTITQTSFPTARSTPTPPAKDTPAISPATASPTSISRELPTVLPTPTPTRTRMPVRTFTPFYTPTNPAREPKPSATPRPSLTSVPPKSLTPSQTITPILTPSRTGTAASTATPLPTRTNEPTLTPIPQPTVTKKPTKTLRPTQTLPPTFTEEPTATEIITDTPAPTQTPFPTDTPLPTNTPDDDDDDSRHDPNDHY